MYKGCPAVDQAQHHLPLWSRVVLEYPRQQSHVRTARRHCLIRSWQGSHTLSKRGYAYADFRPGRQFNLGSTFRDSRPGHFSCHIPKDTSSIISSSFPLLSNRPALSTSPRGSVADLTEKSPSALCNAKTSVLFVLDASVLPSSSEDT